MTRITTQPTDVELLSIESGLLSADTRGAGLNGVAIAIATDGWFHVVGDRLPADVGQQLRTMLEAAALPALDGTRPEVVNDCIQILERAIGAVRVDAGPSYIVPPTVHADLRVGYEMVTSEEPDRHHLVEHGPMNWAPDEWGELVEGRMGKWAIAVQDAAVASYCHTVRQPSQVAAECGVWTHPSHRGRRLASATTAAWARLFAGSDHHLFYSHDERNPASAKVAAHLGLRRIGYGWTLHADGWQEGDAWGRALLDQLTGRYVPVPELETDRGEVGDAMHPEWFFRRFGEWDWWERELLEAVTAGPVLDLGAGAGRAALWFQQRGFDVTAIDSSPGAVRVCRKRGIVDARLTDVNDPPADKQWGAVLLLCGNLGLGGSWDGNRALLTRLAQLCAPGAVLVGDTVEPRVQPEVQLRIRYRELITPWWRQWNIPVAAIPALVEGTGWTLERHIVDGDDHAVLLRRG